MRKHSVLVSFIFLNIILAVLYLLLVVLTACYFSPLPEPVKAKIEILPNAEFLPAHPLEKNVVDVANLTSLKDLQGERKCLIFYDRHNLYYVVEFSSTVFRYVATPDQNWKSRTFVGTDFIEVKNEEVLIHPKRIFWQFLLISVVIIFLIVLCNFDLKRDIEEAYARTLDKRV